MHAGLIVGQGVYAHGAPARYDGDRRILAHHALTSARSLGASMLGKASTGHLGRQRAGQCEHLVLGLHARVALGQLEHTGQLGKSRPRRRRRAPAALDCRKVAEKNGGKKVSIKNRKIATYICHKSSPSRRFDSSQKLPFSSSGRPPPRTKLED